ncbi:MAG: hypothetical protein LBN07_02385 [Christensenellaceae bacterium]|jgi:hypothetical protein|nr:hypothetical protein [Christensenellaceae bacterium]
MPNQILKIGLFMGFVFVLVFLSFLYINFTKQDSIIADSQQGEPVFEPKSPWHTSNPDINFINSLGSTGSETLLAAHTLGTYYFVLFKTTSLDGDFEYLNTNGLIIARLSKTGIITDIKNLGNYTYADSTVSGGNIAVVASANGDSFLILIDVSLNITTNPVHSIKHIIASDTLYLFDERNITTYPATKTYTFEGDIVNIFECSGEVVFFTKQNKDISKYTLINGMLTLDLQFLDTTLVKIALNGEILITRNSVELVITKINANTIDFVTIIPAANNNIEIMRSDTGYAVLTKDTVNYLYFLCLHGDIISKTQTIITADEYQNRFISLSGIISMVTLQDIYTLVPTASIFGDTVPQKVLLTDNILFVQTHSNTLDFVKSQGESDIFIFSLKL